MTLDVPFCSVQFSPPIVACHAIILLLFCDGYTIDTSDRRHQRNIPARRGTYRIIMDGFRAVYVSYTLKGLIICIVFDISLIVCK
jgi:hypothetical protein